TFKENCPDLRNSKINDVIRELKEYGIEVLVHDPIADKKEAMLEYGIDLVELENLPLVDGVIMAVKHDEYMNIDINTLKNFYDKENGCSPVLFDLKGIFNKKEVEKEINYWRM
ncbi:MAG: UDP binding domain-containing protein, partial [Fusobacteriaceae bacterium]